MEVRITLRHTTLSESLRARTEELLSKLKEKNSKKIDEILHIDRSDPIVATGEGLELAKL